MMDTVNAKKGWTNIYWVVNKFLKESHVVTGHAKERASFLKLIKINNNLVLGTADSHHCCSLAQAGILIILLWFCQYPVIDSGIVF
jgi:hypothetical protein